MATPKQIKAAKKMSENVGKTKPDPMGKVLQEAGYSPSTSNTPQRVTETKGFQELMEEYLPDDEVMLVHQQLLKSTRIEHMVFPVYTGIEDAIPEEGDIPEELEAKLQTTKGATLSDADIEEMLAEVNCKVRKIIHGETARHVYFWSPDAGARKAAVELAYKIKGRITNKIAVSGELKTSAFGELTADELRALASPPKPKKAKPRGTAKK